MKTPKVTVLMSVYNGERFLRKAIESILNQTYKNFEFLIINDASNDLSREIILSFYDSRIRFIDNKQNIGLAKSLNKGLRIARGEYIARMDADDISLPYRLAHQIEFMDKNPEIGISGTYVKTIGDVPGHVWKYPCDHETIKSRLLFNSPLAHPTVIIRKEILVENDLFYNEEIIYSQDYDLWTRAIKKMKFANISKILLYYRVQESTSKKDKQKEISNKLRLVQIRELGITPTKDEFEIYESLCYYNIELNKKNINRAKSWLEKLKDANSKMKIYPEPSFSNVLGSYWFFVCYNSAYSGLDSWNLYYSSKLNKFVNLSYSQKTRLLFKNEVRLLARCLRKWNKLFI